MRTHLIAPLAATLLALSACGDGGGIIGRDDPDDPPCLYVNDLRHRSSSA